MTILDDMPIWRDRARRAFRQWWFITRRKWLAPFTSPSALLNLTAFAILLYLGFQAGGAPAALTQVSTSAAASQALIYAYPAYALASMVWAVFQVHSEEAARGQWVGPRFVYHSPSTVLTIVVVAADGERLLALGTGDAEPGSLVEMFVDVDRTDERVKAQVVWATGQPHMSWESVTRATRSRLRLPSEGGLGLLVHIAPEATDTIVRVRLASFELGKGAT